MKKAITVLGSTGSIGVQSLDVARKHGFQVCALTAGRNAEVLERQIREFRPALAAMAAPDMSVYCSRCRAVSKRRASR